MENTEKKASISAKVDIEYKVALEEIAHTRGASIAGLVESFITHNVLGRQAALGYEKEAESRVCEIYDLNTLGDYKNQVKRDLWRHMRECCFLMKEVENRIEDIFYQRKTEIEENDGNVMLPSRATLNKAPLKQLLELQESIQKEIVVKTRNLMP